MSCQRHQLCSSDQCSWGPNEITHRIFSSTISDYYDRQQLFETKDYNATEMMFQVHLKGMQLDAEYEMAGKSVDDS